VNAVSVADWLRARQPGPLFILGSEPEIHHESGLPAVTRYIICNPLFGGFRSSHARQLEVAEALRREPPEYIVRASPESIPSFPDSDRFLLDEVDRLLRDHYRLAAYTRWESRGLVESDRPDSRFRLDLEVFVRRH
jgi:hypothetical protein